MGKAIDSGLVDLRVHDLRAFTSDRHRTVDDTPYGGPKRMVMSPVPWGEALDAIAASAADADQRPVLVIPTPSGTPFVQETAHRWADDPWLVFACGRYGGSTRGSPTTTPSARTGQQFREGVARRLRARRGEAAVLAMVEATVRLVPSVLGERAERRGLLRAGVHGAAGRGSGVHEAPDVA